MEWLHQWAESESESEEVDGGKACEISRSCGMVDRRCDVRCGFPRWDVFGSLRRGDAVWEVEVGGRGGV